MIVPIEGAVLFELAPRLISPLPEANSTQENPTSIVRHMKILSLFGNPIL
jgi:hypothetical protein